MNTMHRLRQLFGKSTSIQFSVVTRRTGVILSTSLSVAVVLFAASPAAATNSIDQQTNLTPAQRAQDANLGIFYIDNPCSPNTATTTSGSLPTVTGTDNYATAIEFFMSKKLTFVQAVGIVANFEGESDMNPKAQEDGPSDTSPYPKNGVGFGIAQWTFTTRQQPLVDLAKQENVLPNTLPVQLQYSWTELTTGYASSTLNPLKSATTLADATSIVTTNYEAPLDLQSGIATRTEYANQIAKKYASLANGTSTGVGTTTTTSCTGSSTTTADCNTSNSTTAGLSPLREQIVCLTETELAAWEPNYKNGPTTGSFTDTRYLTYSRGAVQTWCADFASWIYDQAGDPLEKPNWDVSYVPNMVILAEKSGSGFTWHPIGDGYTPQPGDLVDHDNGGHVNIVISVSGKNPTMMIGGDQTNPNYGESGTVYGNHTIDGQTVDKPSTSVVSEDTYTGDISGYISPN